MQQRMQHQQYTRTEYVVSLVSNAPSWVQTLAFIVLGKLDDGISARAQPSSCNIRQSWLTVQLQSCCRG